MQVLKRYSLSNSVSRFLLHMLLPAGGDSQVLLRHAGQLLRDRPALKESTKGCLLYAPIFKSFQIYVPNTEKFK